MLVVWVLAFAFVACYYAIPAVVRGMESVIELKSKMGLAFPAIAGFIAAGVLPEIAKAITGQLEKGENVFKESIFRGLVWSGLAMMVDTFYSFQARWFGTASDLQTLSKKTAIDMLVFAPLLFVPYSVGMFVWRRENYRFSALASVLTPSGWKKEVFPTYIPNVCFWVIVLFAIYALPTPLQYPLSAFATACWSILFTFLQANHKNHPA